MHVISSHTHTHTYIYIHILYYQYVNRPRHTPNFLSFATLHDCPCLSPPGIGAKTWRRFWTNQCLTLEHFENWLTVSSEDFLKDLNHVSLVVWSTFFMSDLGVCSQLQGPKLDDKWVSTFRRLGWVRELSYLHRKEMMQPMIWCLVRT